MVNLKGELIGINTAITSLTGGFVGYSFAVPSNIARKVFEDLLEYGSVQKAHSVCKGLPSMRMLPIVWKLEKLKASSISSVIDNMGAAQAGLQTEDIIKRMDGVRINKFSDLTGHLSNKRPGDKVVVRYVRDGVPKPTSPFKTCVQLHRARTSKPPKPPSFENLDLDYGIKITANNNRGLNRYGIEEGYFILEINKESGNGRRNNQLQL